MNRNQCLSEWLKLISRSRKLLEDTIAGNEAEVSKSIEKIRDTQYAPTFYNDEQALRYVIKFAYIAAVDQYMKVEDFHRARGLRMWCICRSAGQCSRPWSSS